MKKKIFLALFLFLICFNVKAIEINSKNAVLVNLNTGSVAYEKAKDEHVSVASLQKILTSIVAIENIKDLNETVIINDDKLSSIDWDVYVIGLKDEEEVTYYDLLYATLLDSAGDAAKYLALTVSPSEEEFAKLVNAKAKEIGLENTVYKDPIGLEREGQYSTAYDMYKALEYSLKNKDFKKIFTTAEYKFTDEEFEIKGPRKKASDLDAPYIMGAKTGFTDEAGICLASYIKNGDEEFILVTLNADYDVNKNQNFLDQKHLMDFYIDKYAVKKIIRKNTILATVKTSFGEKIDIKTDEDYYAYVKKDAEIEYKYDGLTKVTTKNKNGDKLGNYIVLADGEEIYKKDVFLNKRVTIYIPPKVRYILIGVLVVLIIIGFIRRKKKI
ncbi:MAG: D-alanyl-D-alanine carboxypeptidase [Bacilli bacterium]|nr:D-alanyl-D-alanine carboxypeptidase [Bacilli bacterium]